MPGSNRNRYSQKNTDTENVPAITRKKKQVIVNCLITHPANRMKASARQVIRPMQKTAARVKEKKIKKESSEVGLVIVQF